MKLHHSISQNNISGCSNNDVTSRTSKEQAPKNPRGSGERSGGSGTVQRLPPAAPFASCKAPGRDRRAEKWSRRLAEEHRHGAKKANCKRCSVGTEGITPAPPIQLIDRF
ncbi:unnamed protein product [Caenorhabditis auriculariae]|uniref:Uncharacterized protein n=1 Tax=Caenorhabditis auriculariae TaxID=2777116 RepID=A0A8S1HI41_9PELO|nr:unnamed protein product [Caenorhabditis auriculariae]